MAENGKEPSPPKANGSRPNGKPEEFQRFQELARKLLKVPKKELDEKRKTT